MCLAFGQNLLMCCTWVKKSASSIMEGPGQPSLHEVECCFFVIMPSILLFCENTSAYVCIYILYQTVSTTAQKGIWGDDTLQQLHPAGGTTASGLCSKSHKRKGEILVSKIEIFILEAKSVFALGSPQGSPQVTLQQQAETDQIRADVAAVTALPAQGQPQRDVRCQTGLCGCTLKWGLASFSVLHHSRQTEGKHPRPALNLTGSVCVCVCM